MIIKNNKVQDLLYTLSANVTNMMIGIITGFLIPKFLGVSEYGYFRIFTFYVGYVGFLHFGFNDGIYIKYGNYEYDKLPKEKFRCYFKFLILMQIIIFSIFLLILNLIKNNSVRNNIMYYVAFNMVILNLWTFFSLVNQFTRRFKFYSINMILTKLIFAAGCILFFIIGLKSYVYFIEIQTITNLIVLFIYMYYDKDLIFGKSEKIKNNIGDIFNNFSVGFFVMVGNFMSIIIIGFDRILIDKFFTLRDFAMYSFAYSMIAIFYILLSSLTTVVYPYLARAESDKLGNIYEIIKLSLIIIIGTSLSGYFILKFIIISYLPKYIDALPITLILIPTILLNGQNSILISNYYKAMKLQKEYTLNNIIALILGIISIIIAYALFRTPLSIATGSMISFILWIFYSDHFFSGKLNINIRKAQILEIIIIILFIIVANNFNWYMGLMIYLCSFSLLIFILCRKEIRSISKMLKIKNDIETNEIAIEK